MDQDGLRRAIEDAEAAATRANGVARAALIIAVIALAVGVLGLGLPIGIGR